MTVLLYDYRELEERAARHLKLWKGWHITLFTFAAIFGLLNYIFLQKTMDLTGGSCVLYPRILEFHMVERTQTNNTVFKNVTANIEAVDVVDNATTPVPVNLTSTSDVPKAKRQATTGGDDDEENKEVAERTISGNQVGLDDGNVTIVVNNVTVLLGNKTHRVVLNTDRTLITSESDCQFAEYMPLVGTIFAIVWITMFTMCPGGGHARSGLQRPWRILTPALLFTIVMMALTAHSFSKTNGGLQAFCAGFYNYTNTTTCSAANPFLQASWNTTWGLGGRVSSVRAASAGAWATWACAAALLLARCLVAPDFTVRRTGVYVTRDPQNKIIPHLKRSPKTSPTKRDTVSIRSEPTATTELVTASVEPGQDTVPSSLTVTPVRNNRNSDGIQAIDLTYTNDLQR